MFFLTRRFHFGKYRGLTLQQVYQGTDNISKKLISSYVKHVLENDEDALNKAILLNRIFTFEINDTTIHTKPIQKNIKGNFSQRIEQIFSVRNNPSDKTYIDTLDNFNITSYSLNRTAVELAGGNPEYIIWCLNKLDHFFIHSMEDLYSLEINRFRGIKVKCIGEQTYEYEPIIVKEQRNLPQALIDFNIYKKRTVSFRQSVTDNYNRQSSTDRDYFNAMTDGQLGNYDDFNGS